MSEENEIKTESEEVKPVMPTLNRAQRRALAKQLKKLKRGGRSSFRTEYDHWSDNYKKAFLSDLIQKVKTQREEIENGENVESGNEAVDC